MSKPRESDRTTVDRVGPADTVETVAPTEPETRAVRDALNRVPENRLSADELDEVTDELLDLARGDLRGGEPPEGPLALAIRFASLALAERLVRGRVACGRARAELTALQQPESGQAESSADVADGSDGAEGSDGARKPSRDEARGAFDVADARLAELNPLAERLAEVSAQANVAALNVTVEANRDGEVQSETVALFAEEVRRLAERSEAVTKRLPVVASHVRDAQKAARAHLDSAVSSTTGSHQELGRALESLEKVFYESVQLPVDEVGSAQAKRLSLLRMRLEDELHVVKERWLEPPEEVKKELVEVETMLRSVRSTKKKDSA